MKVLFRSNTFSSTVFESKLHCAALGLYKLGKGEQRILFPMVLEQFLAEQGILKFDLEFVVVFHKKRSCLNSINAPSF